MGNRHVTRPVEADTSAHPAGAAYDNYTEGHPDTYAVRALRVARGGARGPSVFWQSDWGVRYELSFNVVLIQNAEHTVLVNTGPPADLEPLERHWRAKRRDQPHGEDQDGDDGGGGFVRTEEDMILNRLQSVGVSPDQVTHVVVTPLQLYSTGGIPHFTNAEICLSKRGWVHFHTTHEHPHDHRWISLSPELLHYLAIDAWDRVRLLEEEDQIVPGVRTWWAGTHHRASLAVEIDTPAGVVLASDAFFYYENVEQNRVLGLNESLEEAQVCYERARRVADHLLPLYDPKVLDRYPEGVIAPASQEVIHG